MDALKGYSERFEVQMPARPAEVRKFIRLPADRKV
jgi:hypothetical protein